MNGIEKITARIETDARAEAEKLLSEGQERAAAVRAEYQAKAEAEAKAAAQAGREAAQRQAQRLESAAHMEAKKRMLAAKQECLDAAFEQAKKKLLALPDDQYADLLARMAVRAAKTGRDLLKRVRFGSLDELYAAIGYGGLSAQKAAGRMREEMNRLGRLERQRAEHEAMQAAVSSGETVYPSTGKAAAPPPRHSVSGIIVEGLDNCMVKFSKCCTPVPGEIGRAHV